MSLYWKPVGKAKRRIDDRLNPLLGKTRQRRLRSNQFSIISNNCWGGMVYQYFHLSYTSPTVGLYFFPEEYLKMLKSPQDYLNPEAKLNFINYKESKYAEILEKRGQEHVPIGVLNDNVEVVFLHYKTEEEARDKWFRRVRRIDWDHVLYKFAQMNGCTNAQIEEFLSLEYANKICFVNDQLLAKKPNCIYYRVYDAKGKQITNDTDFPFAGMNIYAIINSIFPN